MNAFGFLAHHLALWLLLAWWLLSAVIDGMPEPTPSCSRRYLWTYRTCHVFAANVYRALRARYPGVPFAGCEDDHGVDANSARPSEPLALPRPADAGGPPER